MKTWTALITKLRLLLLTFIMIVFCCGTVQAEETVEINETTFPDESFRTYVLNTIDKNHDGILSADEIRSTEELDLLQVGNYTGIEHFASVKKLLLDDSGNNYFSSENPRIFSEFVLNNKQLRYIELRLWEGVYHNKENIIPYKFASDSLTKVVVHGIGGLDVSQCPNLTSLEWDDNQGDDYSSLGNTLITGPGLDAWNCKNVHFSLIDLSKSPQIKDITCRYGTELKVISPWLEKLTLETFSYQYAEYSMLDVSDCQNLKTLNCPGDCWLTQLITGESLTALNMDSFSGIMDLSRSRELTSLKLSRGSGLKIISPALEELSINEDMSGEALDIRDCTALKKLNLSWMTAVHLITGKALESIEIEQSTVREMDFSRSPKLTDLKISYMCFYDLKIISPALEKLQIEKIINVHNVDFSACTGLKTLDIQLARIEKLITGPALESLSFVANCDKLDLSRSTKIKKIYYADLGYCYTHPDIENTTRGIYEILQASPALEECVLNWGGYGCVEKTLDFSNNPALKKLTLHGYQITDFRNNKKLEELYLHGSKLANGELDLSRNTGLKKLLLEAVFFDSGTLDLTGNTALTYLRVEYCGLSCLDLKTNRKLKEVVVDLNENEDEGEGKEHFITLDVEADGSYDLTKLKGFDPSKSSGWKGAKQEGNIVVFTSEKATYNYQCSKKWKGKFALKSKPKAVKKGRKYRTDDLIVRVTALPKSGTGTASVAGLRKATGTSAVIPSTVKIGKRKFKITQIEKNAFRNCTKLKSVTIGKYVKKIGAGAFDGCTKLSKVTWKVDTVTEIPDKAFNNCKSLKTIVIPKTIKKIGKNAYKGCKNVKTIRILTTKLKEKKVGANAFKGVALTVKVTVPKKSLKAYSKWLYTKGIPQTASIKAAK